MHYLIPVQAVVQLALVHNKFAHVLPLGMLRISAHHVAPPCNHVSGRHLINHKLIPANSASQCTWIAWPAWTVTVLDLCLARVRGWHGMATIA